MILTVSIKPFYVIWYTKYKDFYELSTCSCNLRRHSTRIYYVDGSVLDATNLFAKKFLPLDKLTPTALPFSIIILVTLALAL
jgi:hypothetical protein